MNKIIIVVNFVQKMLLSLEYLSLNKIVYFIEYRWSIITAPLNLKCRNNVLRRLLTVTQTQNTQIFTNPQQ